MEARPEISVILPVYNEESSLMPLCARLDQELGRVSQTYEILFVDDGSTDASVDRIRDLQKSYPATRLVQLRGNYGKSAALAAGFDHANGDLVFTMDADLQDDPAEIPHFLDKMSEGYDLVSGYKRFRHDPWHKVFPSRVYNAIVRLMIGLPLHDVNCGFKCYRRYVVEELRGSVYGELHRLLPVLAHWRKFRIAEIIVQHQPRRYGKSKFGFSRFFTGLMDLITVSFLFRYRVRPSHLFGMVGSGLSLVGSAICAYLTVLWFLGRRPIGDRPLLILGVLLIVVGMQFVGSGLIAELLINVTQRQEPPYALRVSADARESDVESR